MSGFGSSDRFTDSISGPRTTPLYSGQQITKLDNSIVKSRIPIFVVARVSVDYYIEVDSCYNDHGKALSRANELMSEDDIEWDVLSCELEN